MSSLPSSLSVPISQVNSVEHPLYSMYSINRWNTSLRGRDCWVGVLPRLDWPRYQSLRGGLVVVGEDITFQPKGLSLTLCTGKTMYEIDQQTARSPTETSPSSPCSFHTSGENHTHHKENSNILVNNTVSTKIGPRGLGKFNQPASDLLVRSIEAFPWCFIQIATTDTRCPLQ